MGKAVSTLFCRPFLPGIARGRSYRKCNRYNRLRSSPRSLAQPVLAEVPQAIGGAGRAACHPRPLPCRARLFLPEMSRGPKKGSLEKEGAYLRKCGRIWASLILVSPKMPIPMEMPAMGSPRQPHEQTCEAKTNVQIVPISAML